MKRNALGLCALALLMATSASANTSTYFGFQIGIGNAPPPPVVVYEEPPPVYCEPETRVYIVRSDYAHDRDVFRYGRTWYMCTNGYWYRARSHRGPFVVCDVRSVPRPIFNVPRHRWRHYPQGLAHWNEGRGHHRHHKHKGRGHHKHDHDHRAHDDD